MAISLPPEVLAVLREFRTCEFTSLSKRGMTVTWPVSARYFPEREQFMLTTSIGFSQKAGHIRRNPRVAMLFSNPTGSGLAGLPGQPNPPAVLVQGDATIGDQVMTSPNEVEGLHEYWLESIFKRQPSSWQVSGNPLMRSMMDWYYLRLLICVTPRAFTWWPGGDFSQPGLKLEVQHVEA